MDFNSMPPEQYLSAINPQLNYRDYQRQRQ